MNSTLVAFASTITVLGAVTAELLFDRLTSSPPLGDAEVNVTVHPSAPDPVMAAVLHCSTLNAAGGAVPVPLTTITAVLLVDELLVMVN